MVAYHFKILIAVNHTIKIITCTINYDF